MKKVNWNCHKCGTDLWGHIFVVVKRKLYCRKCHREGK